ncbi:MAG: GNAT family N-acetyltransferase [Saprospiraceae bacterium]|nr:GNAT family N-acetyltransferase [Saprospiraceae bacterium]
MTCVIKHFSDLDTTELYELLKLRSAVFVVEQNCVYQDCDDKDQSSFHLLVYDQDELIASARCLPPGISYEEYCSIGRVVSSKRHRKSGAGRYVMECAIAVCKAEFKGYDIKISAQSYLKNFYESLDFVYTGKEYMEDNIPHCEMIRKNS